jgi:ethanolamine utilization protein EutQ (cupin superfamily)
MKTLFPPPILALPLADIPLPGCTAYLLQGQNQQTLFMSFEQDISLPEHTHAGQWGVVLEGRIDLVIDGQSFTFTKGDRYFIPAGTRHSGKIFSGYADITYFDQPDRYKPRPTA